MLWAVVFLVLIVALMIPILAIVLDAPVIRNLMEARHGMEPGKVVELGKKVALLEDQVDDLGRAVEALKEENQFLHSLLENPARPESRQLPPTSK
jgi:hypothetical protein